MTKEELMKNVRGYIVDGSKSWEEVRNCMVYHLKVFVKILSEHQLSATEFHCILPFFKEVFLFAPDHCEDEEVLNGLYNAVLDCKSFYSKALKNTPMEVFIEMVLELLKTRNRELNNKVELLIFAILDKSRELLGN